MDCLRRDGGERGERRRLGLLRARVGHRAIEGGRLPGGGRGKQPKLAEQYAQAETEKGQRLEEQKRLQTASQQGAIRAAAGASGLDVNDGSPVRLAGDTAALGELDALTIRNNAARSAFGYRVKGMDYAAQAELDNMSSEDAARSGELGMWGSIIGGASSVSDKWLGWKMNRAAGATRSAAGPMSGPDSGLG
jgi:hypothetical protein